MKKQNILRILIVLFLLFSGYQALSSYVSDYYTIVGISYFNEGDYENSIDYYY